VTSSEKRKQSVWLLICQFGSFRNSVWLLLVKNIWQPWNCPAFTHAVVFAVLDLLLCYMKMICVFYKFIL